MKQIIFGDFNAYDRAKGLSSIHRCISCVEGIELVAEYDFSAFRDEGLKASYYHCKNGITLECLEKEGYEPPFKGKLKSLTITAFGDNQSSIDEVTKKLYEMINCYI